MSDSNKNPKCKVCDIIDDHVICMDSNRKPHIDHITCEKFVAMTPIQREKFLLKKLWRNKCL